MWWTVMWSYWSIGDQSSKTSKSRLSLKVAQRPSGQED